VTKRAERGGRAWVVVQWGDDPILVAAVPRGGRFRLGAGRDAWPFPAELLGRPCHTLVDGSGGAPRVCFPRGEAQMLERGARIAGDLGAFRFIVTSDEPGWGALGLRRAAPGRWLPWWGLAAAASAAILTLLAWSVPSLAPDPVAARETAMDLILLPVGAGAPGEPELAPPAPDPQLGALPSPFFEPEGTRCGDLDRLGTPLAVAAARFGLRGPADNPEPRVARQAFAGAAAERGATPLHRVPDASLLAVADPAAPTLPWASEDSLGTQPRSARGKPWADRVGDARGEDGEPRLRMDGGRAKGVELARPSATRRAALGRVVHAQLAVQGALAPTVVERVMLTRLAALRACYHASPASRGPSEGRVDLRLAVAADGLVTSLTAEPSGAAPPALIACMTAALADLAFPASPRGPSAMSYPLLLVPGAGAPPALATIPLAPALERQPWSSPCGAGRLAPKPRASQGCPRAGRHPGTAESSSEG